MSTRTIKNDKVRERLLAFELLVMRGESQLDIRGRMGISRATYYRWLSQIQKDRTRLRGELAMNR